MGVWLRVSSGQQDEANQVPDVERYCEAHGYNIARRYVVHGKSAFKGRHQKDLDAALADTRSGIIRALVIWHSDRLERREGKALLDVLSEFKIAGGRVESTREPMLGQLDMGSQLVTYAAGLMNHEKSRHLGEQVTIAHDRIRANGCFSGRIPFGYATEGPKYSKRLVPTGQGKALVPELYAMITEGGSLATVALWLTEQTGKTWHPANIAQLIRRATYRGHHQNGAGVTVHRCEPLVDAAAWKRANDALNAKPKRGKTFAANRAQLAGALSCPKCEGPMHRTGDGRGNVYYRCTGTGPVPKSACRNMVPLAALDAAVNQVIMTTFAVPVIVRKLIPGYDHSAELAELAYAMQQLSVSGLSWADEDAKRAALRAEYARVQALPSVPDAWEDMETDQTYAGLWAALSVPERGDWLTGHGFTVTADKAAVTVSQGSMSITATLG